MSVITATDPDHLDIMHQSHIDCNAFLGGISKNYGTNYILSDKSDYVVIETLKQIESQMVNRYYKGFLSE